jgi:transposase
VYDKFHIMQHANDAIDEVRRAEFFRKGGRMRGVVKRKRWLLLSRWVSLTAGRRQEFNQLFALNRRVFKAYILKETLDRLRTYHYEGAMLNYLQRWSISSGGNVWSPSRNWQRCCWSIWTGS